MIAVESDAGDDEFAFTGLGVALALRDLPREDDAFEIKDGEVVIFKFLSSVSGNDIVQRADQMPNLSGVPCPKSIEQQ